MKKNALKIAPSVICADPLNLGRHVRQLEEGHADLLHFDIMDGHFIKTFAFDPGTIKACVEKSALPCEVHLLVSEPMLCLDLVQETGADIVVFHLEASSDPQAIVEEIVKRKIKAGIALYPATPIEPLYPLLEKLDRVVFMTIEPGFPFRGRPFCVSVLSNVTRIAEEVRSRNLALELEVDGGIDVCSAKLAHQAGATTVVAGSAIFKHKGGICAAISQLKSC